MSLHLGNLSSRVRGDELERVFQRFGHCNINLKDTYGFVVYDVPAHAEKALRVLRGKKICGESISLSWSRQQPRSLHNFSRGNRLYELERAWKYGSRDEYLNKKLAFKRRRDHRHDVKHQTSNGGESNSENIVDTETRFDEDVKHIAGEDRDYLKKDYPHDDDKVQKILQDTGRWEERVDVPSSEFDGELEFNRYDPYLDIDEKKDVDENLPERYSVSSPTLPKSQDKIGREAGERAIDNLDNSNAQRSCYIYGEPGHEMHNCSGEKDLRRKNRSRFDYKQDNDFKRNMKRLGSRSQERLKFTGDVQMRRSKIDREVSSSVKRHRFICNVDSEVQEETHKGARRRDYVERKWSRRENGDPDKGHSKKVRGSVSSSIHSDHTASGLITKSKSPRSVSRSDSLSRPGSLSSKAHSPSSKAVPQYSGSGSEKSKARSRSRSPSWSPLCVSLHQPLPSWPNKTQMNSDGIFEDATHPDPIDVLVEQEKQPVQVVGLHNLKLENMQVENISAVEPLEEEDNAQEDHIPQDENNNNYMKISSELSNDQYPDALEMGGTHFPDERTDSEVLMLDNKFSASITKPIQGASSRPSSANPVRVSSEELAIVLKHYGLDVPAEEENDLPVEAYFGSARLWPWPIIYYRRLKKGFISTENYAQRIIQNQEFGIVDKFIRSSSGWSELNEENSSDY